VREFPSGVITFLFTDIEDSTKLLHELGADEYDRTLSEHRQILRRAFDNHNGVEIDTQGDAFFVAFPAATGAVAAAAEAQRGLGPGRPRVRMGLHTGTARVAKEGYVGSAVHKGARIAAAGHGGQVLLSKETQDLVDAEVIDLGEHRLKDFEEPVSIYQLGTEAFPPLKTVSNTNLPRPASSFVGREHEVTEIRELLDDGTRLLTLTGPGGAGKTRLAIEAATSLLPRFRAGVFWVGLAPLRDPTLVAQEISQTLGARDGLSDHIGEREMLLVLDNLEHVIEAANDLASLVEACPNLKLLVTSRERLRVRGEFDYPVSPLVEVEAVQLFCLRARREPDEEVAALCRALDNLPLAVELAAARATVLTPRQILERVETRLDLLKGGRDADPRQRTLRATIEWSHDLLQPTEQRLFRRLSIFAGGCTISTAEEVADADLDVLQSLVDKSLLRHTDERFWMLETVREYGREHLEASDDAEPLFERCAVHFTALARELKPALRAADPSALDRIEAEHPNMRAVLGWSLAARRFEFALELVWCLKDFWIFRRYFAEGDEWGRRTLEATENLGLHERTWALAGAADLAAFVQDVDRAIDLKLASIDGLRDLGEDDLVVGTFADLVGASADQGNLDSARHYAAEAIRLARRAETPRAQAFALFAHGYCTLREGRFGEAAEIFVQAGPAWEAEGSLGDVAASYAMAGECFRRAGSLPEAALYLHEGIVRSLNLGFTILFPEALQETAGFAVAAGAFDKAVFFLAASARAWDEFDLPRWDQNDYDHSLAAIVEALEPSSRDAFWTRGLGMSPQRAVSQAVSYLERVLAQSGVAPRGGVSDELDD
jgi:predicted ATPase